MLPIEIIEIILKYIKNSRDLKLILNARLVSHFWHQYFPEVYEYDIYKKNILRKHIFEINCFKTYRYPLLNLERFIEFKGYGGFKYIEYDKFGKVIDVIKSTSIFKTQRKFIYETNSFYNNKKIKFIQEKKYDIRNLNQETEIMNTTPYNLYLLQKEHELDYNKKYNISNIYSSQQMIHHPNCSIM